LSIEIYRKYGQLKIAEDLEKHLKAMEAFAADGLPELPTEGDDVEGDYSSDEEAKEEKLKPAFQEEDENKPAISKPMLGLMGGVLTLFSVYAFYKAN
jgi:hypothetical protein